MSVSKQEIKSVPTGGDDPTEPLTSLGDHHRRTVIWSRKQGTGISCDGDQGKREETMSVDHSVYEITDWKLLRQGWSMVMSSLVFAVVPDRMGQRSTGRRTWHGMVVAMRPDVLAGNPCSSAPGITTGMGEGGLRGFIVCGGCRRSHPDVRGIRARTCQTVQSSLGLASLSLIACHQHGRVELARSPGKPVVQTPWEVQCHRPRAYTSSDNKAI